MVVFWGVVDDGALPEPGLFTIEVTSKSSRDSEPITQLYADIIGPIGLPYIVEGPQIPDPSTASCYDQEIEAYVSVGGIGPDSFLTLGGVLQDSDLLIGSTGAQFFCADPGEGNNTPITLEILSFTVTPQ
jgi:hypothetical protein